MNPTEAVTSDLRDGRGFAPQSRRFSEPGRDGYRFALRLEPWLQCVASRYSPPGGTGSRSIGLLCPDNTHDSGASS